MIEETGQRDRNSEFECKSECLDRRMHYLACILFIIRHQYPTILPENKKKKKTVPLL